MGIRNQKTITLGAFEGKRTTGNLAQQDPNSLLRADGVMRTGDGPLVTAPTPTTIFTALLTDGHISTLYDFQRNVDGAHFLIYQQNNGITSLLKYVPVPALAPEHTIINTFPNGNEFIFVQNNFILYGSNSFPYRFVDKAGTLTAYKWGIDPPIGYPAVTAGTAGTLSLLHGRTYVYAYVSKYTDSLGIVRVSVGAASNISAYSGPTTLTNVAVGVVASTDPQVTHIWVFEPFDAVDATVNSYYFAAELTNATQTFQDSLTDAMLDQSRQAPFENYPAPSNIVALAMYQNRVVVVGRDFVQFSANGETSLGIDQENFPPSLFIQLPAGSQRPINAIVLNSNDASKQSCWIGTSNAWYPVSSIAQGSIELGDKIVSPGTVSTTSAVATPTHLAWIGPDFRVWAWNGIASYLSGIPAQALDFSEDNWLALPGTAGMDSINPSPSFGQYGRSFLKWYSKGSTHFLVMGVNATEAGTPMDLLQANWIAIWQMDIKGSQISSIRHHDIYPQSVLNAGDIHTLTNFEMNGIPMLIAAGGPNQNLVLDMFGGFGTASQPRIATAWLHDESNADCRWLFVDIETDQFQPEQKFTVLAIAAESPDMARATLPVRQIPDPRANAGNSTRFRCILEGSQFVSFGKYLRLEVLFPTGNTPVQLSKIEVAYSPIFMGTP